MKTAERKDTGSMSASFNGDALGLDSMEGYSIGLTWTETAGSVAGILKLQASDNAFLDNPGWPQSVNINPNATWTDITGTAATLTTGPGTQFWNVSDVYYRAVRVVWTRTSGSGAYVAELFAKGIQ